MNKNNLKFSIGLFIIMFVFYGCSLLDNDDKQEDIPLVGPYHVDFENYDYTLALICEMFDNGDDGVLITPTGNNPDSLSTNDVNLQINGEDIEVGQFLSAVAAVYQFNEGEFYDFTLNIKGEISSATLYRPYSMDVIFPESLTIGQQYSIEWTLESNNLNQGFITDTELTYENYDELIYYELDPSIREFVYTNDWLDNLYTEEGSISLALSQWDCAQSNDVYFVSEYYLEENYLLSGIKSTLDPDTIRNKIIKRITNKLK